MKKLIAILFGTYILSATITNVCAQSVSQVKAYSVPAAAAGKTLIESQQKSTGAPFAPLLTLAFGANDTWVNRPDHLVGRVVRVPKEAIKDGVVEYFEPMGQILRDNDSLRIYPAKAGDEIYDLIKKDRTASLSFMGIRTDISSEQLYEYKSVPTVFVIVSDKQLDKTKVPTNARCSDLNKCEYFYISGATVRMAETTLYSKKGKKITVADLSAFGVAKPIEGSIYAGDEKRNYTKKNIIFCTLLRIPE